jgi:undecaprenyl-diphosphatase
MDWLQAVTLALIQGLTEFLPISSSAHLILVPVFTGWRDQGLDFDVIVHAGSLIAVLAYFRREITAMTRDWVRALSGRGHTRDSRLAWWVIIGTVPAGVAGLLLKDIVEHALRNPLWIASGLIGFGLLLGWADWKHRGERDEHSLILRDVLIIGFAQALALIPGTSRSGITMTAALFLGLSRDAAARFSFLLAIPVIAAAGLLSTRDLFANGIVTDWPLLGLAFAVSALSTYLCIHYFLAFIRRIGMQPFVFYRLALGGLLIHLFW